MAIIISDRALNGSSRATNITLKSYRKNGKVYFEAVRTVLDQKPTGIRKARKRRGKTSTTGGTSDYAYNKSVQVTTLKDQQRSSAFSSAVAPPLSVSGKAFAFTTDAQATAFPTTPNVMRDEAFGQRNPGGESTDCDMTAKTPQVSRQLTCELSRAARHEPLEPLTRATQATTTLPTRPKATATVNQSELDVHN